MSDLLRQLLHESTFPRRREASRRQRALIYIVRGAVQVMRQVSLDRLSNQAMALSFQSLFSTIPVIVIALTLLTQFVSQKEVSEIADWLSLHMLPAQAQRVAPEIRRIADSVDVSALGLASVLGLFILAATLFWTLTHIVDDIWKIRQKPPFAYRALSAVVILLLLPTFAGLSVVFTQLLARAQLPGSADFFIPLAVNIAGLWLAYRYVPSARVDPWAALVSAALMGMILELGKIIFSFYVLRLSVTVQGIYGAIAFLPLSLFWLYLLWIIFLFGVELTYTIQNLPELWQESSPPRRGTLERTAGPPLALLVVHRVYRSGGLTVSELANRLEASPKAVRTVLERLEAGGFVMRTDARLVVPARPSGEIKVVDVLSLFATTRSPDARQSGDKNIESILERLEESRDQELSGVTLADLLK